MSRHDETKRALMAARQMGVVSDWIVSSPDGRVRWNVWGPGWERTYSTREAEAFLHGVVRGVESADSHAGRLARDRALTRLDVDERALAHAHAEGFHDDGSREGCPECEAQKGGRRR